MATLTPAQAELFTEANYAVLTTLRADGSPHNTVIWVDYDGANVTFNTAVGRAKHRHIERDGRVTITIVKEPYKWISISGRATPSTDGADAAIDRLAKKYLGEDGYPFRAEGEVRIGATIALDRIDAFGFEG